MIPIRANEEVGGIIHRAMYERLTECLQELLTLKSVGWMSHEQAAGQVSAGER